MSSLAQFYADVQEYRTLYPEWREGQTYFNVLHRQRPELAEKLRTTSLDPFYRDERVEAVQEWLQDNWDVQDE